MIPLKINNKHLVKIFESSVDITGWTDTRVAEYSVENKMFPTRIDITAETYSQDAERAANYELSELTLINAKAKHEITWTLIKADWAKKLLQTMGFKYDYKDGSGNVVPVDAPTITVTVPDLLGLRTFSAYLGQTINTAVEEYDGILYFSNFRIALIER